jgi:menaquinone-dependent protoporphyrinogen oxidase
MKVAILYATREGQTRRIAEYLAGAFQAREVRADLINVKDMPDPALDYDAFIVAASVHIGSYEPEMVRFVKGHRATLESRPSAFVSVSLSAAGIDDPRRTPEQRAAAKRDIDAVVERFQARTGWRPRQVRHVAGAVLYTKYNFLIRFIMKQISKAAGGDTDTTRDHEYTNWAALERFSSSFAGELH